MGMAASQARLLALTSRMHDIELRAQNLESQKLSLATQEDAAYQKYCDALDAKKIQVGKNDISTGKTYYVDANFNTVCGYQPDSVRQYSLINNLTGKVIVEPRIKELYEEFGGDSYTFAWAAMGYDKQFCWSSGGPYDTACANNPLTTGADHVGGADLIGIGTAENYDDGTDGIELYTGVDTDEDGTPDIYGGWGSDLYMSEVEMAVFMQCYNQSGYETLSDAYDELLNASQNGTLSEREAAFKTFRDELYNKCGDKILAAMKQNKNDSFDPNDTEFANNPDPEYSEDTSWNYINTHDFNYYQQLWEQIDQAGGCETINEQYAGGDEGTEWFNNMISSGLVSIYMLDTTKPDKGWEVTTIATSIGNNYLQEVSDDEKAKKAVAEYEHEMKIINRKDTKFDTALKKLETEENACKTEIESIKKVKDENIDRTFNLFS